MGMELRIHRFRHVHDVSILSEKVFGFVRMRQLLYFAFGILVLWRAMSFRDPGAFAFSLFVFMLGTASAILSRGSCSFEARFVLSLLSVLDSLLTPKPANPKPGEEQKKLSMAVATDTSTSIRRAKDRALGAVTATTGLALFALSILTLFGFKTPLSILGVYGLWAFAGASALAAGIGFFAFLCGAFGSPFKRGRR